MLNLLNVFLPHEFKYNFTIQTNEMHIFKINILIFNFDAFYIYQTRVFIFSSLLDRRVRLSIEHTFLPTDCL
jgi:hypothetical protein